MLESKTSEVVVLFLSLFCLVLCTANSMHLNPFVSIYSPARVWQGLFQQFWEKAPGQNWEKKIDFTSKLGEVNDIEHYKGSKIYIQNQVISDCIMPSIPLKH